MRSAIGNSLLLNLVIIFVSLIILFFVGILSYSKAYRVKNRIVEIIEKNEVYNDDVSAYISEDLSNSGYDTSSSGDCSQANARLNRLAFENLPENMNEGGYNYCVFEIDESRKVSNGKYYIVVTFVKFEFPIIGNLIKIPVYGETKILGKDYSYE